MRKAFVFAMVLCAAVLACAQSGVAARGPTIVVDDDGHATPRNCDASSLAYSSIQAAVDFAPAGTTIKVCPGTYAEQVTVQTSGLKLVSSQAEQAVIQAPASMSAPYAIVRVTGGATGVSLKGFTVTGPFPDELFCGGEAWGVRVDGAAQATIQSNHITQIESTSTDLRGCQEGVGVDVGRDAESEFGTATITGNTIDQYQKNGMLIDGAGSVATVTGNTVVGDATNGAITAQNGIQVSRQALGKVKSNDVSENIYTGGSGDNATGILVYQANSDSAFTGNTPHHNDDNLSLYATLSTLVKGNTSTDAVVYNGLYADPDSRNNTFTSNTATGNASFDCEDDSTGNKTSGTANKWTGNVGNTSSPAGLCTPGVAASNDAQAQPHAPKPSPAS
jgi:hypothetical protein